MSSDYIALDSDFKDDVFSGNRKYQLSTNDDGTISLVDATDYSEVGTVIDAALMAQIIGKIKSIEHMLVQNEIEFPIQLETSDSGNLVLLVDADGKAILAAAQYKEGNAV